MRIKITKVITGTLILAAVWLVGAHFVPASAGLVQQTFAQTANTNTNTNATAPGSGTSSQSDAELNTIIKTLIIVEKAFLALSVPLNIVIGKLLSNDWVYLDGDAYKAIETIWILMRNIVNIVFAALLLIIAIAQIAGAVSGSESKTFALKQALPGFIFGLIFVNFSLLACRVILDVGNLATTAAFSIVNEAGPNLIADSKDPNYEKILINKTFCWPSVKGLTSIDSCKGQAGDALTKCLDAWATDPNPKSDLRTCMGEKVYVAFGAKNVEALYNSGNIDKESWTGAGTEPGKYGDFATAWSAEGPKTTANTLFGARNVMMVYTNSIFRLPEILTLYSDKGNLTIGTGTGVLMTTLLTLIFGAMIIFINVALVMALGIRMILIWMILIFSPLMALEFVSDGKFVKGFLSKAKFDKGLLNGLVGLAFMPAIAGLVLSVGFIIFHVLTKVIYRTTTFSGNGTQTFNIPPFNIEIQGSIMPMFSTLGEFIIACILLIILWQALFQMMQTNKYMDGAITKIDKLGRTIAGSAKMIPFIPMPGPKQMKDGKPVSGPPKLMSWAGLARGTEVMERGLEQRHIDEANAEVDGSWFNKFKQQSSGGAGDLAELRKLNNAGPVKNWKQEQLEVPIKIITTGWHGQQPEQTNAQEMARHLKALAERTNMTEEEKKGKDGKSGYYGEIDNWLRNSGDHEQAIRLGRTLSKTLHDRGDAELKTIMAKYGYQDNGVDITGAAKPAPAPTGPQTIPTTKTHETKDPTTGNVTHYSISVRNTSLNGGKKPVDLHDVPAGQMTTLGTAIRTYNTTPTAANMGALDASLLAVLRHGGITAFPAELAGTANEGARRKLAEEINSASAKPVEGHTP